MPWRFCDSTCKLSTFFEEFVCCADISVGSVHLKSALTFSSSLKIMDCSYWTNIIDLSY